MKFDPVVAAIVAVYLLAMLLVGWYASRRIASGADFLVAGRRLGPFLMAGTLAATEIGGGSSLGVVESGMSGYGLSAAWYIIAMGFAFVILTALAPHFRAAEVTTVPEYFRRRYGKAAGLLTAAVMLPPLVGLTAGQFMASATILSAMTGLDYRASVIVVAVVVTVYAVLGGLWSVTLTDFIQVFLIVAGMVAAIPYALRLAGGWENVTAHVPREAFALFSGYGPGEILGLTVMYLATFTVGQEAVSRYYAARDGKAARQGSLLAAAVNFVYAFVPAILGVIVLALVDMGRFSAAEFAGVGARYALPVLAMAAMPPVICGLLFAGIISATMSSSDSDLLGAGAIFANDIYRAVLRPGAEDRQVMAVTRWTMAAVGGIAMAVALLDTQGILDLLMFCFTLRGAGAFFPYVLGHYWAGASPAGAIASLAAGSAVVVYLERFSGGTLFGAAVGQPVIPGLLAGLAAFWMFSKLFPPKERTTELAPEK